MPAALQNNPSCCLKPASGPLADSDREERVPITPYDRYWYVDPWQFGLDRTVECLQMAKAL
jgi:hypothetical protein